MTRHKVYASSRTRINLKLSIYYLFIRTAKRFCFSQIGQVNGNKQTLTLTDYLANVLNSLLSL